VNTDAKRNIFETAGYQYYGIQRDKEIFEKDILFAIRDIRETKGYLEANYPEICKIVREKRTLQMFQI
jgi:hypothetical protein